MNAYVVVECLPGGLCVSAKRGEWLRIRNMAGGTLLVDCDGLRAELNFAAGETRELTLGSCALLPSSSFNLTENAAREPERSNRQKIFPASLAQFPRSKN